jgi:predicted nucleotidyltransferase
MKSYLKESLKEHSEMSNTEMIKTIAKGLSDKLNEVVFVGGALLEFYVDDPAINKPRVTDDVDIVIEIATRAHYDIFEENLRKKGFINDLSGPSCRMIYQNVRVDIIATKQSIAGFTNKWYDEGFQKQTSISLDGIRINILTIDYYIASKFEAFKDRGGSNIICSLDFEDIVYVFDGKKSIESDIINSDKNVKEFLKSELKSLLENTSLKESLAGNLGYRSAPERSERIIEIFKNIVNSK